MENSWKYTEDVLNEFCSVHKGKYFLTDDEEIMEINPQRIISINNTYAYPDILNDDKMKVLKKSYKENKWLKNYKAILGLSLLMLPNGDLLVNGGGNHRAVLAKEEGLSHVKAFVSKVRVID
ncbi:hypothetical protein [Clostridium tertium]|uniref:hypothetical protein n=1 Tax=Clostridium tertium TaxID=1559 RepID=UPI0034A5CA0A